MGQSVSSVTDELLDKGGGGEVARLAMRIEREGETVDAGGKSPREFFNKDR